MSLPVCYGNGYDSTNLESLGRLISIREPRIVQVWKETVTYELVFEKKRSTESNNYKPYTRHNIRLHIFVNFFGSDPNTIEATDNNFPKHIYTSCRRCPFNETVQQRNLVMKKYKKYVVGKITRDSKGEIVISLFPAPVEESNIFEENNLDMTKLASVRDLVVVYLSDKKEDTH